MCYFDSSNFLYFLCAESQKQLCRELERSLEEALVLVS